jgi:hypothetical protein
MSGCVSVWVRVSVRVSVGAGVRVVVCGSGKPIKKECIGKLNKGPEELFGTAPTLEAVV